MGQSKMKRVMEKQFPGYKRKSQNEVMYERAINRFTKENHSRQLNDTDIRAKMDLKLFHFHIEAFDDQIAINKFNPDMQVFTLNPKMVRATSQFAPGGHQRNATAAAKQSFGHLTKKQSPVGAKSSVQG
jgi:hypothetical protein